MYSYQSQVVRAELSAIVTLAVLSKQKTWSGRVVGAVADAVIAGGWKSSAEVALLVEAASEKAFHNGMVALHQTVSEYMPGTHPPVNPHRKPTPDTTEESDV